jgi:valyl-tRNA synthetase
VAEIYPSIESILSKQINAEKIDYTKEAIADTVSTVIGKDKFYVVTSQPVDTTKQKQEWLKELEHLEGFLATVMKKLSNEKFVQNAKPEVLDMEKKKQSDAETKIKIIRESLAILS